MCLVASPPPLYTVLGRGFRRVRRGSDATREKAFGETRSRPSHGLSRLKLERDVELTVHNVVFDFIRLLQMHSRAAGMAAGRGPWLFCMWGGVGLL